MNKKPPEKIVYFVRHGQSQGNISPVFQAKDSPLSSLGKKQAELIARRAAKLSFEKLIASPLARAKETAIKISELTGKSPEYSELFAERIKPSAVSGKFHSDKNASKIFTQWEKSLYTPNMRVADGENFEDLMTRVDKALQYLQKLPEKNILVVTHGFFLRTIIFRLLSGDFFTPPAFEYFIKTVFMENTGLSVIKYGPNKKGLNWHLWIYNDHAHLG